MLTFPIEKKISEWRAYLLSRYKIPLIIAVAIFGWLLVYSPHFDYRFPFHVDEWHHITEAVRFNHPAEYFQFLTAEPQRRFSGLEIGFHILLSLIGRIFDLVLIYRFLPATWAILTALTLFYVFYNKRL